MDVRDLIEEGQVVKGIGDVYGRLFDEMGYERVFKNLARQKATLAAFKDRSSCSLTEGISPSLPSTKKPCFSHEL